MNYIKNIENYLLYIFITFLPITLFFRTSYLFSISLIVIFLILFTKIVKIGFSGKILLSTGSFDIPILLFLTSYLLSTFLVSPNIYDSFIAPGTTLVMVLSTLFYFLVNQLNLKEKGNILNSLFFGITIYSVFVLLTGAGILPWFKNYSGYFSNVLFMSPLIPILFSLIYKQKEFLNKFLIGTALLVTLFSLFLSIFNILPNKIYSPKYPSFKISTDIAINTIKKSPFFGVGPGNYIESFNKYRAFEYNATELWSSKFNQGSSFILTCITEAGLFGLFAFFALSALFVNFAVKETSKRIKVGWGILGSLDLLSVILLFLLLIFFPSYPIQFFILFIIIGTVSESKKFEFIVPTKIASVLISLPILALLIILANKIYIYTKAEYYYLKSIESLSKNNAKDSFLELKSAIKLNSKIDRYHKALSSVNFGIASSLSKKKGLTDEEKDQITLFVQESINEAKAAVSVNNQSSSNWEFLGKTYHLIIPLASGSDKFAIDSYKQAIALDPINPSLRLALGEVYMTRKDYKNAIETFKMAILAKDDFANAHFNLGLAYKENNEIEMAKTELQKTLSLLDVNSKNYEMARKELDNVGLPKQQNETIIEPLELPADKVEIATDEAELITKPIELQSL